MKANVSGKMTCRSSWAGLPNRRNARLVLVRPVDAITDGDISIIGPDISSMEEGKHYPLGILVEIAGAKVEPDLEGVIERRIHEYSNYIEGFMHLNQRYDIWIRLSKKSFKKGLNSFRFIGKVMLELFRNELPILEKDPDHVHHRSGEDQALIQGSP